MDSIEEREKWLNLHFFIKPEIVQCLGNLNVEKRKDFVGLSYNNQKVLLPTIFDGITLVNSTMACVSFEGKYGFYDVYLEKWIIEPLCDSYSVNEFYKSIEIVEANKHGLIDIEERRLLVSPHYDEISANSGCRYIWVKKDGFYHYVKRSTGEKINMPGAEEAYDSNTDGNVMFIKKNGIVECVDENGHLATSIFRRIMKRGHGRLKLSNSKENSFIVIDIYGRILKQKYD